MDPLTIYGTVAAVWSVVVPLIRRIQQPLKLFQLYGLSGLLLYIFGSSTSWRTEAHILGSMDDADAMNFRKSVQDECTMVSVAAAIVAQLSITALSLDNLSNTLWIARGAFLFSLISSLMAVYYATTQQRTMGRLLQASQVRGWIRGRLISPPQSLPWTLGSSTFGRGRVAAKTDPDTFQPKTKKIDEIVAEVIKQCFTPSPASVLTISAPQILLSSSLLALLVGVGVYYGFIWTRDLDPTAGRQDSRNIVIVYIVSTGVCWLIYSVSGLITDNDDRNERDILYESFFRYVEKHPDVARGWYAELGTNRQENGSRLEEVVPPDA